MKDARDQLQVALNRLLLQVGRIKREFPDPVEFWPEFAGRADAIVDAASPQDYDWVVTQLDRMLEGEGLLARMPST